MRKRICVFGGSTTFGHSDLEGGGWVDRLKREFWQRSGSSVFNLAISGAISTDLLERLESESKPRKPDIIMISTGGNDSRYVEIEDNMPVPLDDFRSNAESLYSQAHKIAGTVVFVGLTRIDDSKTMPIPWQTSYFYTHENFKKYDAIVSKFCVSKGIHYISMWDTVENSDLTDGMHPNAEGHQKMFERVRDYLLEHKLLD